MALDLDSMDMAHGPAGTDTPTARGTMAPTIPTHGVTPHIVPDRHAPKVVTMALDRFDSSVRPNIA